MKFFAASVTNQIVPTKINAIHAIPTPVLAISWEMQNRTEGIHQVVERIGGRNDGLTFRQPLRGTAGNSHHCESHNKWNHSRARDDGPINQPGCAACEDGSKSLQSRAEHHSESINAPTTLLRAMTDPALRSIPPLMMIMVMPNAPIATIVV